MSGEEHQGHGRRGHPRHTKTAEEEMHTDIDNFVFNHLHPPSRAGAKALRATEASTQKAGMPRGYVSPMFGKFLSIQARLLQAKNVLEVGTLAGYSSIWLALEVPGVHVTTVEYSPKHAAVARENMENAGVSDRITVLEGAGLEVLPRLLEEVESGKRERFDLTFIDADKLNSYAYCDLAVRMSRLGACVFIDNVMGRPGSRIDDPNSEDEHAKGGRNVVEKCGEDSRIDGSVLQFVGAKGYDGFYMGIVTSNEEKK